MSPGEQETRGEDGICVLSGGEEWRYSSHMQRMERYDTAHESSEIPDVAEERLRIEARPSR